MQHVISTEKINLISNESYTPGISLTGVINTFITWCGLQEKNRFLWLGVALFGGIGSILPLTLFAIISGADNNFNLWLTACVINVPILVVNLAAQPTKVTLPVMFFAWIVDAVIISYSIAHYVLR